jgi:phytoene synthase
VSGPGDPAADLRVCHEAIRRHSRSFYAASRLLPRRVRDAAVATYAFCRAADDAVDEGGALPAARARHDETRRRLDAIYAGAALDTPAARAFARVVATAAIPRAEPDALLAGMAQDLGPVRIADEDALTLYCYRAAGVVGCMMSRIMGRRDADALRRAIHLGVAMQLTNIARDVGEDATRDRVYLPASWLAEAGGSATDVLGLRPTGPVCAVTRRVLDLAEAYYASGIAGIGLLPPSCRPAILAAALLYREIGRRVRARGGDGITSRVRVGTARRAGLLLLAVARAAADPRLRTHAVRRDVSALHATLRRVGVSA